MPKIYDTLVYIGRFQPLHNAHLNIIKKAAELADKVIIIVGSANQPRTFKNPFTYEERRDIIISATSDIETPIIVAPNIDTIYDDAAWIIRVQHIVNSMSKPNDDIGIIGFSKDEDTSRYLKMFPQWELYDVPHEEVLHATQIRDLYFSIHYNPNFLQLVVPEATMEFLQNFCFEDEYMKIIEEKRYVEAYRKKKEVYEYPIIAVTCDAVVIQAGHILLIKRRSIPGKGLWALPGGYFDAFKDREPLDGILRELKEETKIDLPDKVLRGSLLEIKTFSAPGRSLLGRSITFAGRFRLSDGEWNLPKIKGSDDAEKAKWVPLSEVHRDILFDDHFDIIQHFVPSIKG